MQKRINVLLSGLLVIGLSVIAGAAGLQVPHDYDTIQAAIDASADGDVITVANGTYTGEGNRDLDCQGKAITIQSQHGAANCTIDCQGSLADPHRGFSLYSGEGLATIIDGFTIINGYASGNSAKGAAIYCNNASSPIIRNCIFQNNTVVGDYSGGGAIGCGSGSNTQITNCSFSSNQAGRYGGAVYASYSNLALSNCTFTGNAVTNADPSGYGGAVCFSESTSTISHGTLSDNTSTYGGGAIGIINNSNITITDSAIRNNNAEGDNSHAGGIYGVHSIVSIEECNVENNTAEYNGGIYMNESSLTMQNTTIQNNQAQTGKAGGMGAEFSDITVSNTAIQGNHADDSGGGIYLNLTEATIENCSIRENASQNSVGGGIYSTGGDVMLTDTLVEDNSATEGGGLSLNDANSVLTDCQIIDNTAVSFGGGMVLTHETATLKNSIIRGNRLTAASSGYGGGIYGNTVSLTAMNLLGEGNSARNGGAIALYKSNGILTNCTLTGNQSETYNPGIYVFQNTAIEMGNCILWGNYGAEDDNQLRISTSSSAAVSFCDVQGGQEGQDVDETSTLSWGDGNRDDDPDFAVEGQWDPNETPDDYTDDSWTAGCYYLLPGSPCRDTGDNSAVTGIDTDLEGNPRVSNGIVDLGAYERNSAGLTVAKMTLKAGRSRQALADTFQANGTCQAAQADFENAENVLVRVGSFSETLPCEDFRQSGSKPVYAYRGTTGLISSLKLDMNKHTFQMKSRKQDLTGLVAPVPVELVIGGYCAYGSAADEGAEDVINGKKYVPMQYLYGYEDALRIEKVSYKQGTEVGVVTLTLNGSLAAADLANLSTQSVTLTWGAADIITNQFFTDKNNGKYQYSKKSTSLDRSSVAVTIDFTKCTFKITAKNINLGWQASPVTFRIQFEGFDQTATVPID